MSNDYMAECRRDGGLNVSWSVHTTGGKGAGLCGFKKGQKRGQGREGGLSTGFSLVFHISIP